jgi:hypothetical protein
MATTVLKRANPNLHGWIELIEDTNLGCFFVTTPDDEDGAEFDGDKAGAHAYFEEEVKRYSELPNWELQARYDEEHGTINGYSPWQFNREQ